MSSFAEPEGLTRRVRFLEFVFDPAFRELHRDDGTRVPLQPKPLQLLEAFLRDHDRVIPKDELLERIWPDTIVSETALTSALRDLRRALGDSARNPRFVETRRGRGFAVVATIEVLGDGERPTGGASLFVGRRDILRTLFAARDAAIAGTGRIVLLAGEPGIGKTRILEHLEAITRRDDCLVARAWCADIEGAPPYWPWVQILRELPQSGVPGDRRLNTDLVDWGPDLMSAPSERSSFDWGVERFQLFESVARRLRDLSLGRCLILLIDDLHDADSSSLRLFEFLAYELPRMRTLIVGAYRNTGTSSVDRMTAAVTRLMRHDCFTRLGVGGLERDEVSDLIRSLGDRNPDASHVDHICERTDGNPFFVRQLVNFPVRDTGDRHSAALPVELRDVLRMRMNDLEPDVETVLGAASVAFGEVTPAFASALCRIAEPRSVSAFESARRAGFVVHDPGMGYRFAHQVIREAVYANLSATDRSLFHRRAGEFMERQSPEVSLSALARHFRKATEPGGATKAYDYASRAGQRALELLAFDDAARHFEHALETESSRSPELRCALLLDLGEANTRAGYRSAARSAYRPAFDLARGIGDTTRLAEAAYGYAGRPALTAADNSAALLLEESLRALPPDDNPLRIALMTRLAGHKAAPRSAEDPEPSTERFAEARALLKQAREMSERVGDPASAATVLDVEAWMMERDATPVDRERVAVGAVENALRAGDPFTAAHGHFSWIRAQLEQGQVAAADRNAERLSTFIDEQGLTFIQHYLEGYRACRSLMRGDLLAAERLSGDSLRSATRVEYEGALIPFGARLGLIRIDQGRLSELEGLSRTLVENHAEIAGMRCGLAVLLARIGQLEEAHEILDELGGAGFRDLREEPEWRVSEALAAEACALVEHRNLAGALRAHLEPHRDSHVVMGAGQVYLGPVSYYVGLLADCLGDHDAAERLFRSAADASASCAAPLWEARAVLGRARALVGAGERGMARELLLPMRSRVESFAAWGLSQELERVGRQVA